MAESSDGQEKTEDPTAKRMGKAREDGQIASSKELFVFTTLFMGVLLYLVVLHAAPELLMEWRGFFNFEQGMDLNSEMTRLSWRAFLFIVVNGMIFSLPIVLMVLATQSAMDGQLNFSVKAAAFKGSRIDPLKGLKRMFSTKALVEMGKALLKVGLLTAGAMLSLWLQLPALVEAQAAALLDGMARIHVVFISLMVVLLIILSGIAVIDVIWQRHQHTEQLRMTRQEVKDENKQTEGSPEVKARIRRMQYKVAERAMRQKEAIERVGEATAIITNPTHFAVALKYEVGSTGAPIILAKGRGILAQTIVEKGLAANVTVFQSAPLARALFFVGELGEEIPKPLFNAVAAVLVFIFRLSNGETPEEPDVDVPADLLFDEDGNPIHAKD
jgi:flagellar biosynthetic protein FlhB